MNFAYIILLHTVVSLLAFLKFLMVKIFIPMQGFSRKLINLILFRPFLHQAFLLLRFLLASSSRLPISERTAIQMLSIGFLFIIFHLTTKATILLTIRIDQIAQLCLYMLKLAIGLHKFLGIDVELAMLSCLFDSS